jgi:xanthine dehydrogenase accessory factor
VIPAHRIEELTAARRAFVVATVVRAAKPTSVRPGDSALVHPDGTIEGFVGGVCAQESVRLQAARALETGEATLLRLLPGLAITERDPLDGVVVSHNPCLSGGALEIFLDPQPVAPRIAIVGDTPIARALTAIARAADYEVGTESAPGDAALVVASHGEGEETALAAALEAGVEYIALVASPKRGAAVLNALDEDLRGRIHTPAGLDIGARTPADIAISILAQLIAQRTVTPPAPPVETATDPICGMEVLASEATVHLDTADGRVYFCCEGCRSAYAARAT